MPSEVCERLFDPFFTTKEQGKGTGLGLATALGIVQQSRGAIWFHSEEGRGTTFKIYLPRTDESPESAIEENAPLPATLGGTVLLVEDEPQLRAMMAESLKRVGYDVITASAPVEALGLLKQIKGELHLLVTDVVMPQMSGTRLAAEVKQARPDAEVLFVSGYTDDAAVREGIIDQKIHFLPKPFSSHGLLSKVAQLIGSRAPH
jgi:CheY-like chemotaxis protein